MSRFTKVMTCNAASLAAALLMLAAAALPASAATKKPQPILDIGSCAMPTYPQADLAAEHVGKVTLKFLVNQDGAVAESKVFKSSGYPGLDQAAREALAKCRFNGAKVAGKPVWVPVQYVWQLK